jgi:hypothetical protein
LLVYAGLLLAFSANSAIAQNAYTAYINSDNNAATGCTITLPGGTLSGADLRVQATLTPGATPTVTGVTLTSCSGGTFGAGTSIGGGSVDLNTGVSGSDSVEFSIPGTGILNGGTQTLALGFTAESPTGSDVMFTRANGGPIIFGITVPTPALGAGALVLLALLIMGIGHRFGRTRWYRHMAALSLVAMCGVALAAAFNWNGISPIVTDPSGDPTNGSPDIDLRAGFVAVNANTIYFRIDVADLQTQAPQITSANATTFVVGQAGTFTMTSIGVPSAAFTLGGCTLPTGVTFTDNGNGTGTLSGTPASGSANTYACTLTAANGIPPDATQAFTLTVANAPSQTALAVDINPSVYAQSVTFTATVTPAPPGSGTPTGTVNFLDGAVTIGSGALNGSGVATFATGGLSVATHPVTAQYTGDADFGPSTSAVVNQVVNQASQTITFTSTAPVGAVVGGTTYTVAATASSGLTVALTIDASAAGVCSLAGSTVSFIGVGNCVIDANQAGDANYTTAPQVQQSFAVGQGSQAITFTSTAPVAAAVGGATYAVTATGGASGNPVVFTIDAAATSVCSIAGSTVSFIGVGTCVIDANQAGNANYTAAPQAQQSFAVAKGSQTITFTSTAPTNAVVAGPTYAVTATASSGLPVILTIDASATSVCSLTGSMVSFTASGTCVIDANQAGDADYNAAAQAQQSFAVSKNDQTITFTSTAPVGAVVAGAPYTVTATASSGLTVVLTIDASAASVCSIAGSTVSFSGAGNCVIDANQAGDGNYNAAPQVQQSFAVGKGSQTISFTSTAPVGAVVGGATYTVAATATSGLPVTLTIDAGAASVCSIAGSTVSFIGAGTCVIDANQAGNANYNAAPQAQQSFTVGKGTQAITFTSTAPTAAQFDGTPYNVGATASSGLTVTFTIDPTAASVCSISGSTVTFTGVGTCVINADQAGDSNWNPAPQVQQSFAVAKANQTISFTSTPPPGVRVSDPAYTVTATSTSGLTVTFSLDATSTGCALAGSIVTFSAGGSCVIDADQAGNANYDSAAQVQQSFVVAKLDQTITFTSTAPSNAKVGGATYNVTATASSGLPVTFSGGSTACTVAGSTVSFVHATTCIVDADQAGNAQYNPAPQAQQSFAVAKGDQTITFTSTAPGYGSATAAASPHTYTAAATATSGLAVVFSTTGACSNTGSSVTFGPTAGGCTIDADQPGDSDWNVAPQVNQTVTVEIPATADNDSDTVTGNVAINVATANPNNVLTGDTGTDIAIRSYGKTTGGEQTSIGSPTSTAQGGSVTLNSDGSYSYDPPANFTGTDTFLYIIGNDLTATSTGTVTLTVGDRIMVVATAGVGAADCKPQSACTLATADANAAVTSGKDLVFVESGSYGSATFSLLASQAIVGQKVALSPTALTDVGITLAPDSVAAPITALVANTTPTLNNTGNVIVLGGGNLVEYFAITNSAGAAIAGTSAGSGTSNIHDIAVNNTAGNGVSLTANLGTVNFSNLTVTTSSGNAFAATGGGTVSVTVGSNPNTLASTTGTALNVSNTLIGAGGLTFQSISANGAAKGMILNSTGTGAGNGGLSVTGTGTTAGSGGTIQNISVRGGEFITTKALSLKNMNFTNANTTDAGDVGICDDLTTTGCNAAIYLRSVSGAAFDRINITGTTVEEGINGNSVSNFTLSNSTLTNCGTSGSVEEGCIKMRELTGTSSITDSDLSFPGADVVEIVNTVGPLLTLNVNNTTFRDSQSSATGNTGLQARSQGTASMVLNVTNSSFLRIRTVGLQATAINSASNDVDVSNSTFDTGAGTMIGLDLDADNTGTLVFNVQNNPKVYAAGGPAINVFGDTNAIINGRINNNPDVKVFDSTGHIGTGIRVNINKDATAKLEIKNNGVNVDTFDEGIEVSGIGKTSPNAGGATNSVDATITGNSVTVGTTAASDQDIRLLSATGVNETNAICVNVANNTTLALGSSLGNFRARVPTATGFLRLQGFATDVPTTWNANGNTPTTGSGGIVTGGGAGTIAACTAALPTNPPLN